LRFIDFFDSDSIDLVFKNCSFMNNQGYNHGGGALFVYLVGGVLSLQFQFVLFFNNSVVGAGGGAISIKLEQVDTNTLPELKSLILDTVLFDGNVAFESMSLFSHQSYSKYLTSSSSLTPSYGHNIFILHPFNSYSNIFQNSFFSSTVSIPFLSNNDPCTSPIQLNSDYSSFVEFDYNSVDPTTYIIWDIYNPDSSDYKTLGLIPLITREEERVEIGYDDDLYLGPKDLIFVNGIFSRGGGGDNNKQTLRSHQGSRLLSNTDKDKDKDNNEDVDTKESSAAVDCGYHGSSQDVCVNVGEAVTSLKERLKKDLNVESVGSYGGRVKRMTVVNILISPGFYEEKRIEIDCLLL
jgi:hypothetical protein